MNIRTQAFVGTKLLAAGAALFLSCTVSHAAFADGMPFGFKPSPTTSNVIPDTPDNTSSINATGIASGADAVQPAQTAAQLPKPLPPQPSSDVVEVQPNSSFFGLSVGEYDPFHSSDRATSFNAELQPGVRVLGVLQPLFGAMATTKGSAMAYAGVGVPFHVTRHIFLMPSVGLGLYKAGGGYDLDRALVGRVGAELAYQFDDKSRLGLNFDVITNGKSLQAQDRTEMLALTYTRPFTLFSGPSHNADTAEIQAALPDASSEPVVTVPETADSAASSSSDGLAATATIQPAAQTVAPATIAPAVRPAAPSATSSTIPSTTAFPSSTAFPAPSSTALTPTEKTTHDFP